MLNETQTKETKKTTSRHIINKLLKIKDKDKSSKQPEEKDNCILKRKEIKGKEKRGKGNNRLLVRNNSNQKTVKHLL